MVLAEHPPLVNSLTTPTTELESLLSPTPQRVPRTFRIAVTIAILALAGACSDEPPEDAAATSPSSTTAASTSTGPAASGTATATGSTSYPAAATPMFTEGEQTAGVVQAAPDPARVFEHVRYLAVEIGPRKLAFPAWQFVNGKVLEGIPEVLGELHETVGPWMAISFFLNPSEAIGRSPLEALRAGDVDAALEAARDLP